MNTGEIFDFYDDPQGLVLKKKVDARQIPEFVKRAQYKSHEALSVLPDDAFALVMVDGGKKFRKYACIDSGNTTLSVIYFMENKDKLTKEAQVAAASNLVHACLSYGIEPPEALLKVAKTGKQAELSGTEVMPMQASHPDNDHAVGTADEPVPATTKKVASRYVDVTGRVSMEKKATRQSKRFCLEKVAKFPIDSYGDVLEANKWFEENHRTLDPSVRREYCTKLAARADELGISVTDNIRKYAGTRFASEDDVRAAVATRMQFWSDGDPERTLLEGLMGKYASAEPEVFCEALTQFDKLAGLDVLWDHEVVDPVASTFGFEKCAEWSWSDGPDILKEDVLLNGVLDSGKIHQIRARFGEELAKELVEKPVVVFGSLPRDTKRIICHILQDTQP